MGLVPASEGPAFCWVGDFLSRKIMKSGGMSHRCSRTFQYTEVCGKGVCGSFESPR